MASLFVSIVAISPAPNKVSGKQSERIPGVSPALKTGIWNERAVAPASDRILTLLTGLVSYWKLDGDALDSAGTNHGTLTLRLVSNPTNGTWPTSKISQGIFFSTDSPGDGLGGGVISCGTSLALDSMVFSASAWIRPTELGYDHYMIFGRGFDNSGNNFHLRLSPHISMTANILRYVTYGSSICDTNANNVTGPIDPVLIDVWQHVVVTRDVSHIVKLYLNGILVANSVTPVSSAAYDPYIKAPTWPFQIGQGDLTGVYSPSGNAFKGGLDEVGYWNKVLTPSEVAALYNGGAGLTYPF